MSEEDNKAAPFHFSYPGAYAENHGFFLGNEGALQGLCESDASVTNLLHRFTTTDEGDQVAKDGIAMPIFVEDSNYYTLVFRHVGSEESAALRLADSSDGWILRLEGGLCFGSLGALKEWGDFPGLGNVRRYRVQVPDGWYRIQVRLFESGDQRGDSGVIDVVMERIDEQPAFGGDLFHVLSFAA